MPIPYSDGLGAVRVSQIPKVFRISNPAFAIDQLRGPPKINRGFRTF